MNIVNDINQISRKLFSLLENKDLNKPSTEDVETYINRWNATGPGLFSLKSIQDISPEIHKGYLTLFMY